MSESNKFQLRDYSRFDSMSSEALQEILKLDSQLPSDESSDVDAILYIMEVLAQREIESGSSNVPDVEAAWRTFNEHYRPNSEDDDNKLIQLNNNNKTSNNNNVVSSNVAEDALDTPSVSSSYRKAKRGWFRMGFVATFLIIFLVGGTLTASAFGFDIWSELTEWTGEVFGFQISEPTQKEASVARQLSVVQQDMERWGVPHQVLPSYLPSDYSVVSSKGQDKDAYIRFSVLLSNEGNNNIVFDYRMYKETVFSGDFEKEMASPEQYVSGGITHFIMENAGKYFVAWMFNNVECSITGVETIEEVKQIIDSIYGG